MSVHEHKESVVMSIDPGMTVGQIAACHPGTIGVFDSLRIDFCCRGSRTLAEACSEAGVDLAAVIALLASPVTARRAPGADWADAGMSALADHIEADHHRFAREAFESLRGTLPKVFDAHAAHRPALARLGRTIDALGDDMHEHMIREERVLFPWLRRLEVRSSVHIGPPWSVRRPIRCMEHDHEEVARSFAEMRSMTSGYTPPGDACPTYASMLRLLVDLERDTRVHIHKENNILFPAGVRAERARASASPRGACQESLP